MLTPGAPCVLALAGGIGGAKLALGLSACLSSGNLVICVNTGDDDMFHGLYVSPDLDTMMYTLSGFSNKVIKYLHNWKLSQERDITIVIGNDWNENTNLNYCKEPIN